MAKEQMVQRATCLVDTKVLEFGSVRASSVGRGLRGRRGRSRRRRGGGSSGNTLGVDYGSQKEQLRLVVGDGENIQSFCLLQ